MQHKKLKKSVVLIMATLIILVGYGLIVMPYAIDWYSRIGQTATISGYKDAVDLLSDEQIENQRQKTIAYNAKISEKQEQEFYRYSSKQEFDFDYKHLPVEGSSEICTVEIPKINVNMPVGHGTDDNMLQTEAGHLYGTSLPIGGESTHSVIAAHSALRTAEMFSRLDELEKGDVFYINILKETHAYEVTEIRTVLPEECDQYMQIIPGEDQVTLYTCTPYGINTHRLLVTGNRIGDPINIESTETVEIISDKTGPILVLVGIVGIPVVLAISVNVYIYYKEKREKTLHCKKKGEKVNV